MANRFLIRADENGNIMTWGEDFDGGIEIPKEAIPLDWSVYSVAKYIYDGSGLVVRPGWSDPTPEPSGSGE